MPDATIGQVGSFNRSVGVKLDMDDAIVFLTPDDVPLQRRIGSTPTSSIKVEWLEEDLTPQHSAVSAVVGTDAPWTVTVADGGIFRAADVLHVQDAAHTVQFLVTAVSGDDLTVDGFGGNTTDPAVADVLEIIGQYTNEGSDPVDARSVEGTALFNYTQIGQEKVEATRTQRKRAMYGSGDAAGDPYDKEVRKKFRELAIRFERSMVNGVRAISGDSKKRFMGGLFYYISTNTSSNTSANAKTAINSLLRSAYEDGGTPKLLMVSPAVKAAISTNVDATLRRSTVDESTGGSVIERFLSDFGEVSIEINRHFPATKGLLLQEEYIERAVFDPYAHELLAKTGDADQGEIVGEFSLRVKNEPAHGILTLTDAA